MKEHGSFEIKLVGQVLVIKAYDAWNLETVLRLCDECSHLISQIKDEPWATIVDLSCWELGTPDIWKPVEELNVWANDKNYKYQAVIISFNLQETMLKKTHEVLTHTEKKFCKDTDEAFRWLSDAGIKILK
jgi:hypothetical protein